MVLRPSDGRRCLVVPCHWCGIWGPWWAMTVDHLTPRGLGGSHAPDNLVASCFECNQGRNRQWQGSPEGKRHNNEQNLRFNPQVRNDLDRRTRLLQKLERRDLPTGRGEP